MPILNREDAAEVDEQITRIFAASDSQRVAEMRRLFVEIMDFSPATGTVSLAKARKSVALPENAERLATMSGVTAVYFALDDPSTNRVRKAEAAEAAKLVSDELAGDILLVFMNSSNSQVHFIYPTFEGRRPSLRRLVIERDLPRRTAIHQLSNIYWNWEDTRNIHGALQKVYDVEAVTAQFFQRYKTIFDSVMEEVQGFGSDDGEQEAKKLFVQTLFNRMMFVYYLSRKGWITFNGSKDYLNALWNDYPARSEDKNFYSNRLIPLFFTGLNNPRSADLMKDNPAMHALIGDVPFLNGGLFDQWEGDDKPGVVVPDDAIEMILGELFDRFNFTVMESTPFDVEVAVDPEMLGKVFEELITERHKTGAFYTPRPIVSFMCRESLKGYLESSDTGATPEAIRFFVDEGEASGLSMSTAPRVAQALAEITVVDPACGSGAYLVGMMQELVELQTTLYSNQLSHESKDMYALKLAIIERNIYGADIDPFAVNIAMLRLWLSLSIEGEDPMPLPNLDFKVVCGNSLTGPNPTAEDGEDMFRAEAHRYAEEIARLKGRHLRSVGDAKSALAHQLGGVRAQLAKTLGGAQAPPGAVDWRVEFAEVFDRGGFDIVLANPPYEVVKDPSLRSMYNEGVYGRMNLYGLFIQRSLQLMGEGASLVFINPRTLLTDKYFTNLRRVIKKKAELTGVVLIEDRHNTFDRVLQACIILLLTRVNSPAVQYQVRTRQVEIPTDLNDPRAYLSVVSNRVLLSGDYDESFYVGSTEFEYEIFERMVMSRTTLSSLA